MSSVTYRCWYLNPSRVVKENKIPVMKVKKKPRVKRNTIREITTGECTAERQYHFGVQVCVPANENTTVVIPMSSLVRKGQNRGKYFQDYWYMTNDLQQTGWETMVADLDNEWTPKWGTTENAKQQKNKITLVRGAQENLVLTFDLTKGSLYPTGHNTGCWGFLLWAYVKGNDPSFYLFVCQVNNNNTTIDPTLGPISLDRGVTVYKTNELTTDQTYEIMTGVTGLLNNWLLLAEQAGIAAQTACLVCLGPRPLMRIVPPPPELTPPCMINLMSRSNPSASCKYWDKIYPMTKQSKTKPFFSNDLASGNFTCFYNETGAKSVGHIDSTLCQTNQSLTIWVSKVRVDVWWYCGGGTLRDALPKKFDGTCALISLLMSVNVFKVDEESLSSALQ